MNFVQPYFLIGTALSLLYGLLLLIGALRARRARIKFGDEKRINALVTHDASKRRAWKGVFLMLATALAFVAAARPQYGKGQRLVPATNVDVVLVLDYSKSMYAQDVQPSRSFRAKVEVQSLIKKLRGARFGAVAFAGEPLSFPLTYDGSAIAAFFRNLEPNDMPVGGTAIARALEQARETLRRDPKAKDHRRIVVLITDGEDLEGSPTSTAKSLGADKTTVHVVQIGGRTPEQIPNVDDKGKVTFPRLGDDGKPMFTELTARGERQLKGIAEAGGGRYIVAAKGTTGIDEIATELQKQMKTEFSERIEEVYADVFMYPLWAAVFFLILEAILTEAPRRLFVPKMPPVKHVPVSLQKILGAAAAAGGPVAVAHGPAQPWGKPDLPPASIAAEASRPLGRASAGESTKEGGPRAS